jgi:hypothetical protein
MGLLRSTWILVRHLEFFQHWCHSLDIRVALPEMHAPCPMSIPKARPTLSHRQLSQCRDRQRSLYSLSSTRTPLVRIELLYSGQIPAVPA